VRDGYLDRDGAQEVALVGESRSAKQPPGLRKNRSGHRETRRRTGALNGGYEARADHTARAEDAGGICVGPLTRVIRTGRAGGCDKDQHPSRLSPCPDPSRPHGLQDAGPDGSWTMELHGRWRMMMDEGRDARWIEHRRSIKR